MKFYTFCKKFLNGFFSALFKIEVKGAENVPGGVPLLVCSNHLSNWDPVLLGVAFDRQIRFMAKKELFKIPLLSSLIKLFGAFPVNRGSADPSAIKTAIGLLKENECVGLFPQGTRFPKQDPKNTEIKNGAGMILYRSHSDAIPVSIKTKNYKILPFRKVFISIGKPISYDELGFEHGTQAEYTQASKLIFDRITDLL